MPIGAFRRLLRLLARDEASSEALADVRRFAIKSIVWLFAAELVLISTGYPISLLCDTLLGGKDTYVFGTNQQQAIWLIVASAIVIGLVEMFVSFKMNIQRNSCEEQLWRTLTDAGNRHLKTLDQAWHDEHGTTEKESLLTKNRDKLWHLVSSVIFSAAPGSIQALLISLALLPINWRFALVSVGMVVVYVGIVQLTAERLNDMHEFYHQTQKQANDQASEDKNTMNTIIVLGLGKSRDRKLAGLLDHHYQEEIKRFPGWLKVVSYQGYVLVAFYGLALFMAAESYQHGTSIGEIAMSLGWIGRVSSNLFRLSELQHALSRGGPALGELCTFFETVSQITAPKRAFYPAKVEGEVELASVWFRYAGKDNWQLRDVSIKALAGSMIALVGPSGAGKSTWLKLVPRLYDPQEGQVLIDGHDVRLFDPEWLRREVIGVVNQEVQMFSGTVFDNITLGVPDVDIARVVRAADMACVSDFVMEPKKFPQGLFTQVGENGVRLSGGERARVALARVLLRMPPVILLDEAMASLDNKTERKIMATLDELMARRDCTIITIAHRLTTVQNADEIFAIDDGEVKQRGKHAELLAQDGLYAELWHSARM